MRNKIAVIFRRGVAYHRYMHFESGGEDVGSDIDDMIYGDNEPVSSDR